MESKYRIHLFRMFAALAMSSIVLAAGGISPALAEEEDEDEGGWYRYKYNGENRGRPVQPPQVNAKFRQECSDCHVAYAPGLLPAESWRKVMAGLDQHFGTDASISEQDNREITAYLVKYASNRWRAPTAPLRISESSWFRRKHDSHEIDPAVWKKPSVKSPANCGACHIGAERGDYSERNIRMPR